MHGFFLGRVHASPVATFIDSIRCMSTPKQDGQLIPCLYRALRIHQASPGLLLFARGGNPFVRSLGISLFKYFSPL